MALSVVCCLLLCGCVMKKKPAGGDDDTEEQAKDVVVVPDVSKPAPMPCPIMPTVDGRFTGWPGQTACAEWNIEPLKGVYGDLYIHYTGQKLHMLNDWHLRAADIPSDWYNLFEISTGDGQQQWDVRVYRNGKIDVLLNGKPYGKFAKGAYGFGLSPKHNQPHTMFEFALSGVAHGEIKVVEKDPSPGKWETPEQALRKEPKSFSGVLRKGGGTDGLSADHFPIIVAIIPRSAPPATKIEIIGSNLGVEDGDVKFASKMVTVTQWDDDSVQAIVPELVGDQQVVLMRADGQFTNSLLFHVDCVEDCSGRECGPGTCGGSCGKCGLADQCNELGKCVCQPLCTGPTMSKLECGMDGCGGVCGTCPADKMCKVGVCVLKPPACKPDCHNKTCGPDGCGGSCGSCTAKTWCKGGICVCLPQCKGKQCGADGCGGVCGDCGSGAVCDKSKCVCQPKCDAKTCGADGCGGSCGTCPGGDSCVVSTCCAPKCAGKQCGWDGCGGSCGTCTAGKYCLQGKCACQPKCNGKVCGADGCGGSCGDCKVGVCQTDGSCLCTANCKDKACGDDGCGGSCGQCDPGEKCSNGNCL